MSNKIVPSIMAAISIMLPSFVFALGGIVHDPINHVVLSANHAELLAQLKRLEEQYQLLHKSYQTAMSELQQDQRIAGDNEGSYGFGGFLNSSSDLRDRQWSPDNWSDALKGLSGGNPARYQELVNQYQQSNPTLSQSDYKKGASQEKATRYSQDVNVNKVASVNATYAFNDIKKELSDLHDLSSKIDQTQNTKSSIDLNSRIEIEIGNIQTQELKMQVLLNQQTAQNQSDSIAAQTASAKFNQLPEE